VLIYIYLSHRYQLDNGNTRYERAYWLPVGKDLVLAKKGYYSVPLPNDKYSTVFYTADHRGYHVDMREFHCPKVHSHSKPLMNLLYIYMYAIYGQLLIYFKFSIWYSTVLINTSYLYEIQPVLVARKCSHIGQLWF